MVGEDINFAGIVAIAVVLMITRVSLRTVLTSFTSSMKRGHHTCLCHGQCQKDTHNLEHCVILSTNKLHSSHTQIFSAIYTSKLKICSCTHLDLTRSKKLPWIRITCRDRPTKGMGTKQGWKTQNKTTLLHIYFCGFNSPNFEISLTR